ncbi:hypothetical protein [Paraburkholderia sediminicola]|uniref:hypothetical protein n=1 Tax=Paraburkholderia sediminicola TaxID=458836 RepID=UPI00158152CC|nr:hypothetical protein [Paraburkholderia sediminicola]
MKNVSHPNMFPIAGESVAIAAAEAAPRQKAAVVETPVDDISAAPVPASAWANPLSKLRPTAAPGETKHATRADEAIAYLRIHGPSPAGDLCKAMGITSKGGITPFINAALRDGRIVRNNGKYSVGGEAVPKPDAEPKAAPEAISHFEATTAIVAGRKKAKPVAANRIITDEDDAYPEHASASANLPVAASEAAAAIAAMRQPAPAPAPPVTGRKPEFVVFVGDIQLLSWPDGDITIQTESSTVDLTHQHFRALITLVELRGGFSVVSRRL